MLHALAAELVLAGAGLLALMVGVFSGRRAVPACNALACLALLAALVLVSWPAATAGGIPDVVSSMLSADAFANFGKALVAIGCLGCVALSLGYNRVRRIEKFEFAIVVVFATVGMFVMVSAVNFIPLYLGLELQSLCAYILAAFASRDRLSVEAAVKYFALGSLASAIFLFGVSFLYASSGTLGYAGLAAAQLAGTAQYPVLVAGMACVIAGFAFKVSAAPFHMWTPDVYQGAPTPVTFFMGTAPKVAALAVVVRLVTGPFLPLGPQVQPVLVGLSVASMLVGAVGAIGQTDVKRLLAYSSIGHMGYALIGIAAGTAEGVRSVLVYLATYLFMTLGVFACLGAMRRQDGYRTGIADFAGLSRTDPYLAFVVAVIMFGMAGIPPMSGFFGKLFVFKAAIDSGMWTLSVIGVLSSVVGAFYYLRIIKLMYFDEAAAPFLPRPAMMTGLSALSLAVTGLFFLVTAPVLRLAGRAALSLLG